DPDVRASRLGNRRALARARTARHPQSHGVAVDMDATGVHDLLVGAPRAHAHGESPGGRLARACSDLVAVDSAGVVLIDHHGNASPLGVSSDAAGAVEDLQFTLGEGPA